MMNPDNRFQHRWSLQVSPLNPVIFLIWRTARKKCKRTRYYSGWYLGLPFNIEFPNLRYSMGGTIGFQCIMGRRWYWNISIRPGFTYADSHYYWSGAGDFGLGLILNKM
jgi:hypothetical protein